MTKPNHYFQIVCHSHLGVKKKKNSSTPIDLKVYTLINNVPSETKWASNNGEPLYSISGISICLTFAKYNFYWESNLHGSYKLILIAFDDVWKSIG